MLETLLALLAAAVLGGLAARVHGEPAAAMRMVGVTGTQGKTTTTLESKTNFLRPIRLGDVARAVSLPLHIGRTTQIWQTTITRGDGKAAAIVTQTQVVIDWKD